jgi:UDPglucose 6-dehydrogenase
VGLDSRIGTRFLQAGVGYGGSCFGKDVDAFAAIAAELGYQFPLLHEVQKINLAQRRHFVELVEQALWIPRDKTIAVLGLAFKPETDDMRDAPSIDIIEGLLERGARVRGCDPQALETARAVLGDRIEYTADPYEALAGADCMALVTEWDQFRRLDLDRVKATMAHPTVIDGRNVFDPADLVARGFVYTSMGR